MSGDKEPFYWQTNPEWYRKGKDGKWELTEKAPERARKSFELANIPRSEKKNPFIKTTS